MTSNFNLCHFGWDGLSIPTNCVNICSYLPKWQQIKTLRNPQHVGHHDLYFPHHYFHDVSGNEFMPAFEKGELHNDGGGYAQIFRGQRAIYKPGDDKFGNVRLQRVEQFAEICIKEVQIRVAPDEPSSAYEDELNAILYEAYLHALIYKTLCASNNQSAVPQLHEVVALTTSGAPATSPQDFESVWFSMEFIEGQTLEKFLRSKLKYETQRENEELLLDVMIQLAYVLHVLQVQLKFNHRDLKINNVYVRHHAAEDGWSKTISLDGIGTWNCKNDIVLIDFGFSCIACGNGFPNPRATLVGAGSYFRPEHDCLKLGRDLAQFLYSLHCSFPLQNYVRREMFEMIHTAVEARRGVMRYDLFMGIDHRGNPVLGSVLPRALRYSNGIYAFLRETDVDVLGCEPLTFLRALRRLRLGS